MIILIFFLFFFFFFFNDTATTEIYTLSLHDALPISLGAHADDRTEDMAGAGIVGGLHLELDDGVEFKMQRSEEHTSELQSPCNLVCRLLLEKKKKTKNHRDKQNQTLHVMLPLMLSDD